MKTNKTILVTGGCGFIGSHFVRMMLSNHPDWRVVNVDKLTYAGNPKNVADVAKDPRYKFYKADIGNMRAMLSILKKEKVDTIVNFAAESDNNKAVGSPVDFAKTNVVGTGVLLEAARQTGVSRFHHISTCEVFGQLELDSKESFSEQSPYKPRTPYNASKAGADHLVMSYFHTYGLPVTISYCANNYGSHQFPEKVFPVFTIKALLNKPLPVFQSSQNKREWIDVSDHCSAIELILEKGVAGQSYAIGTGTEKSIAEVADTVLRVLGKPATLKKTIPDRPGHDTRYLLDSTKMRMLGWKPVTPWDDGIAKTIRWYRDNPSWWRPLLKKSHSW